MMKRKKMATLVSKILAFGRKYISARGFCWLCVGLLVMVACDPDVKSHTKDVVINSAIRIVARLTPPSLRGFVMKKVWNKKS